MSGEAQRVLLLGGTSEIGLAIVSELAREGAVDALLLGRRPTALEQAAERLRAAGCRSAQWMDGLQAGETEGHGRLLQAGFDRLGGIDVAILAVGMLDSAGREGLPDELDTALEQLSVNFLGAASLLMGVANRMRAQRAGTMVVLSSVAAQRPRRANAVYGASKAGLDSLSQALSDELAPSGVRVITVRPGFVRTRMTRELAEPPLACEPRDVAKATLAGVRRGAQTVWAPASMRWVMIALSLIPRPLFRRMSL
jgi:decaprenylphospho-beta-D-erythro-pentofuranosid-2-ulose 2-reductase